LNLFFQKTTLLEREGETPMADQTRTHFILSKSLKRYPHRNNEVLQAWDAADELYAVRATVSKNENLFPYFS
jgi:hypothetical protein